MTVSPKEIILKEGDEEVVTLDGTGEQRVGSSIEIKVEDTRVKNSGWGVNIESSGFEGIEGELEIEKNKYTSKESGEKTLNPWLSMKIPKVTKFGEYETAIKVTLNKGGPIP